MIERREELSLIRDTQISAYRVVVWTPASLWKLENEKLLWSSRHWISNNLRICQVQNYPLDCRAAHKSHLATRHLDKKLFTYFSHLPWLIKWRPIKLMAKQRHRFRAFFSSSVHKFSIYLHQREKFKMEKGWSEEMKSDEYQANRKMRMKISRKKENFIKNSN